MSTKEITISEEIDYLRKRFEIYHHFMMNYYHPVLQKISIWGLGEMKKRIDGWVEKKQIKDLRHITKDINSDLREELPPQKYFELKRLFKEQLGEDIETEEKKYFEKIEKIKKRGKIKTENEFRLIDSHINLIFHDEKNTTEVQQLEKLLATF